jgi:outer membrane protein assembly factor BamB
MTRSSSRFTAVLSPHASALTGALVWNVSLICARGTSALSVYPAFNVVIVQCDDNQVAISLSGADGGSLWQSSDLGVFSGTSVQLQGLFVFGSGEMCTQACGLQAISIVTGFPSWHTYTSGGTYALAAVDNHTFVAALGGSSVSLGYVQRLNASEEAVVVWSVRFAGPLNVETGVQLWVRSGQQSTPCLVAGPVLFAAVSGSVFTGMSVHSGEVLWTSAPVNPSVAWSPMAPVLDSANDVLVSMTNEDIGDVH